MPRDTSNRTHTEEEHKEIQAVIAALEKPKRPMTPNRRKLFDDIVARYRKFNYMSPQSIELIRYFYFQHCQNL